ncbi:hypothetical protein, conserved [Babesia ovata]|uniref:Uncharacterized protein n=1 Tax=Babesia ovata TaxID=189622 RepID=A0A2H6KFA4_9APIC|nr:uncharacterized protein BOVATA_031600 [Babesia ovata]GBE61667.1 hypothetical protein, conserved [Babesia ovata]
MPGRQCGSEADPSPTAASTPTRRMSDSAWDEKWQAMVQHQKLRKQQDAQLHQKLKEKQEMEEFIECTFTPKTHCTYKSRSSEELLKLMEPLITEEERILRELAKLNAEEQESIQLHSRALRAHIASNQGGEGEDLIRICEHYREERLKEIARIKNKKLDIVGLLHEVERKYNIICVKEHLNEDDMLRACFSIDSCRLIKKEILDSVKGVDTLKDRSRVTAEIDTIIKRAKEDVQRQRAHAANGPFMPAGAMPGYHMGPQWMQHQNHAPPYAMVQQPQPNLWFQRASGNARPPMNQQPQPMMMNMNPAWTGMRPQQPQTFVRQPPMAPQKAHMQTQGMQKPKQPMPRPTFQAPQMRAHTGMVPYPGFAPVNPQFGYPPQMQPVQPQTLRRNVAKKVQQ